jgi:hypothetical protein
MHGDGQFKLHKLELPTCLNCRLIAGVRFLLIRFLAQAYSHGLLLEGCRISGNLIAVPRAESSFQLSAIIEPSSLEEDAGPYSLSRICTGLSCDLKSEFARIRQNFVIGGGMTMRIV